MITLTLKANSKKRLGMIEELAKELGITVEKHKECTKERTANTTTLKAIKEAKSGKTTRVSINEFRKLLYT
jgi:hypothetical protein